MRSVSFILSLILLLTPQLHAVDAKDVTFFEKEIRPILVERCLECHSADTKIKGGLALDTRADWMTGGDAGPAIVIGKPDESPLIHAVSWQDLDLQMPPKKKLSDREIQMLTEWVQRGAPDPREPAGQPKVKKSTGMDVETGRQFWSYAPLKKTAVPPVKNKAWPKSEIDSFILAGLEKQGLRPTRDAEPAELARRMAYVLTGLPPSLAQLERFSRVARTDRTLAVRELMDELLGSMAFAERWAGHWLDITRFAESSGGGRTLLFKDAWRYRDYVVQSMAQKRPWNQMIREQIAGDLLPASTAEERTRQLIATGFLALGPTIYEEQDKQRLRFDVIDEQLDTLGKAFLGQTLGCARCHDHKFDPIPQRDYYALAGIFASTRTLSNYKDNVVTWINAPLPLDPAEEKRHSEADARFTALQTRLKETKNKLAKFKDVKSGLAQKKDFPIPLSELTGIVLDDQAAKAHGNWKHSTHSPHYFGKGYLHDDGKDKGTKTLTFTPRLQASGRYEVRLAYPALKDRAKRVPVHIFHAMGDVTVFVDQSQPPDIEGRFVSLGSFQFEKEGDSYVIVSNEGTQGFVCADVIQFIPEGASDQITKANPQSETLRQLQDEIRQQEAALAELKQLQDTRPITMSVREEDEIGDTQIRVRGEVHQRAATVPRGFLTVVAKNPPAIPTTQSGRLELADWLVSADNPLTARVLVNRVWTWLFGQGLVRSVDNFGTTGEKPTHPELLDHLALRFQHEGWDVQSLIREIILSRTWQLAVAEEPRDPDNRWLSHAHRRRLDAEQIRDTLLHVSGALDRTVGGPNIRGANAAASDSAEASDVEFGYQFTDVRRSLYTPAFRNNRLELFATFDFSDNNTSQGQRHSSTVAPQALYFMNHPFVIEQSERAAQRILSTPGSDDQRLHQAFLQTLGRMPYPGELEACQSLLQSASTHPTEGWSMVYQSLFGSVDFRYLD